MCLVSQPNTTKEVNICCDRNINDDDEEEKEVDPSQSCVSCFTLRYKRNIKDDKEEEKEGDLSKSMCLVSHPNATNGANIRYDKNINDDDEEDKEVDLSR